MIKTGLVAYITKELTDINKLPKKLKNNIVNGMKLWGYLEVG